MRRAIIVVTHGAVDAAEQHSGIVLVERDISREAPFDEPGPESAGLDLRALNVLLGQAWLSSALNVNVPPDAVTALRKMDNPANMKDLANVGRSAAGLQVKPAHFPPAFDLA